MIFLNNLKKIFLTHKEIIISISFILFVALISITWFRGNYLFSGSDFTIKPNGEDIIKTTFYLVNDFNGGSYGIRHILFLIPLFLFISLSDFLGISLSITNKIWLYYLFVSSGVSSFYLATVVFKHKYRILTATIVAIFYMFNIYIAIGITQSTFLWLTYSLIPLKLGFFIKGILEKRGIKYIFFISVIWLLTSCSQYNNPKFAIFDWAPLILYLLFFIVTRMKWKKIKYSLKFTIIILLVFILINSFWILPVFSNIADSLDAPRDYYNYFGQPRLNTYISYSSELIDGIRLQGYAGFDRIYSNSFPKINWAETYHKPFFVFISFLIPILAFISLLILPRRNIKKKFYNIGENNLNILYFILLTLVAIFLMVGANPPFGRLNLFFAMHIPFFTDIVSIPYRIFGMYISLGFSILIGYVLVKVHDLLHKKELFRIVHRWRLKIFIILILIMVILLSGFYVFPLWTGSVFHPGNKVVASNRYKIPGYYTEAEDYIKEKNEEFRILPIPYGIIYYRYLWEPAGYFGPDLTNHILNKTIIAGLNSYGGLGKKAAELMLKEKNNNIAKILPYMNGRYILLHRDADFELMLDHPYYISSTLEDIAQIMNNQKNISLKKSIGKLSFYKISDELFLPKIYAADTVIDIEDSGSHENFINEMCQLVTSDDFIIGNNLILSSDLVDGEQAEIIDGFNNKIGINLGEEKTSTYTDGLDKLEQIKSSVPKITFQKINPVKYIASIEKAKEPFFLVLSGEYQSGWKAYIRNELSDYDKIVGEYPNVNVIEVSSGNKLSLIDNYFSYKPIDDKYHFLVNGYANAWYIDPGEMGDTFEIMLYFRPQRIYYAGVFISIATFIGFIIFIILGFRRRKYKRYRK